MASDGIWLAILTLLGVVLGYIAKPVGDVVLSRETARHGRIEAARTFQRELLLELQPKLVELVELAALRKQKRRRHSRERTGDLSIRRLIGALRSVVATAGSAPESKSETSTSYFDEYWKHRFTVSILAVRVMDDELRQRIQKLVKAANGFTYGGFEAPVEDLNFSFYAANNQLGKVLRTLYEPLPSARPGPVVGRLVEGPHH